MVRYLTDELLDSIPMEAIERYGACGPEDVCSECNHFDSKNHECILVRQENEHCLCEIHHVPTRLCQCWFAKRLGGGIN